MLDAGVGALGLTTDERRRALGIPRAGGLFRELTRAEPVFIVHAAQPDWAITMIAAFDPAIAEPADELTRAVGVQVASGAWLEDWARVASERKPG